MLLHVISDTGEYMGRMNSFISVDWTEEYCGKGKLAMYCYDTDETAKMLRQGYLLYRADRKTAMEIVRIDRDDQTRQIYVGGYTTLNLLSRRVITAAYDANVGESSIYGMVTANLRGLPIEMAESKGLTEELGETVTYENARLYESVQEVCQGTGLGVRMLYDPDTSLHTLEVYKGADHTVDSDEPYIASAEFGNLLSLKTTEDDDYYKNTLVITGTLTGGQTVWVRIYTDGVCNNEAAQRETIWESGLTQREAVTEAIVDNNWSTPTASSGGSSSGGYWATAYGGHRNPGDEWTEDEASAYALRRSVARATSTTDDVEQAKKYSGGYTVVQAAETGAEFADRLAQAGVDKLKEYTRTQNFDAQISPDDFNSLYSLGDIITCKSSRYGMQFDARVNSFRESEEYGKYTLSVVLGTPEIDPVKGGILTNG